MAFAVLDFETTGLAPERGDRVAEIGLVLTDDLGRIEYEWTTTVNPQRDIGASHIHGLRAKDLLDAPLFAEVADDLLELVAGRTVAAHNASFDMRFLHAELSRAGYAIDQRPSALCTMRWAGRLVGPAKLEHCCEALGIELSNAHNALNDARATAQLLSHLVAMCPHNPDWSRDELASREFGWPASTGHAGTAKLRSRDVIPTSEHAWLDSVLSATWIPGVPADEAGYLLVLDRALLDRKISLTEGRELEVAAKSSGLPPERIEKLHLQYLRSLAQEALADQVVTAQERLGLEEVAHALRLTGQDIDDALALAMTTANPEASQHSSFTLITGDRIVFTGEMSRSRDDLVGEIVAAGLCSGGVTKSTKLLVTSDPDSMSGKAAKARAYGIPVVDEDTFTRYFDAYLSSNS